MKEVLVAAYRTGTEIVDVRRGWSRLISKFQPPSLIPPNHRPVVEVKGDEI
jgi:hypothetical protein